MAIAASEAGGLESLPCAMLDAATVRAEIGVIRQHTTKPVNVNFFCHTPPTPDPGRDARWQARLAPYYRRAALRGARDDQTALTNVFSGRPARGLMNRLMQEVGPMSGHAPAFPTAGRALAPLKAKAEASGVSDFSSLWSGQAARLGREMGAGDLTRHLAAEAERRLKTLVATG